VILNGRVIDPETNYDKVSNVGIKDGKIAKITEKKIKGKKTIDATGHVVSPGFIDLHAHGQNIGDYRMQAMQGVTTMLELESGLLPIRIGMRRRGRKTCRSTMVQLLVGPMAVSPRSPARSLRPLPSTSRTSRAGPTGRWTSPPQSSRPRS
jgi:hypothetical protein